MPRIGAVAHISFFPKLATTVSQFLFRIFLKRFDN